MKTHPLRTTALYALIAVTLGAAIGAASTYHQYGRRANTYAFSKPTATNIPQALAPAGDAREPVRPLIVIDEGTTHDFGIMSRNEQRSHTFVVRNQGTSTLQIRFLDKTCMCTDIEMTKTEVRPGDTTEITMIWKPSTFKLDFHQSARFETNDPSRIELDLTVKGKVQQIVQAMPRSLSFDGVTAGQSRQQELFVFAYRDTDLRIDRVELLDEETAPFFETEIQSVDDETLAAETGAVAGQRVTVTVNPGLPLGRFFQRLRIHLNKPGLGPLEVSVVGNLVGNISLVGPGYDSDSGRWNLGKLSGDQEHTKTLWILIKGDEAADAQLTVASVQPADVLQAELKASGSVGSVARHMLKLTLRPQKRVVNRLGNEQGDLAEVVINTTHSDFPQIRIPVSFALEFQPSSN